MRQSVSVVGLLLDTNGGDVDRALYLFRNVPLTELGGETAERYVANGKTEAIRRYIHNLAAGATSLSRQTLGQASLSEAEGRLLAVVTRCLQEGRSPVPALVRTIG